MKITHKNLIIIIYVHSFCRRFDIFPPLLLLIIIVNDLNNRARLYQILPYNYNSCPNILKYLKKFVLLGYFIKDSERYYSVTASGYKLLNDFVKYCNNR